MLSFLTGGMLLAIYLYEKKYREKYFFYFNQGHSKLKLIVLAQILNVLVSIVLFTLEKVYYGL